MDNKYQAMSRFTNLVSSGMPAPNAARIAAQGVAYMIIPMAYQCTKVIFFGEAGSSVSTIA